MRAWSLRRAGLRRPSVRRAGGRERGRCAWPAPLRPASPPWACPQPEPTRAPLHAVGPCHLPLPARRPPCRPLPAPLPQGCAAAAPGGPLSAALFETDRTAPERPAAPPPAAADAARRRPLPRTAAAVLVASERPAAPKLPCAACAPYGAAGGEKGRAYCDSACPPPRRARKGRARRPLRPRARPTTPWRGAPALVAGGDLCAYPLRRRRIMYVLPLGFEPRITALRGQYA